MGLVAGEALHCYHFVACGVAADDAEARLGDAHGVGQQLQHRGVGPSVLRRSGYTCPQRSITKTGYEIAGCPGLDPDADGAADGFAFFGQIAPFQREGR